MTNKKLRSASRQVQRHPAKAARRAADIDIAATGQQRYATFNLELLLNDDNTVRRMHMAHVQSGEELPPSADWNESQLVNFVIRKAGLHIPVPAQRDQQAQQAQLAVPQQPIALRAMPEQETAITQSYLAAGPAQAPHITSITVLDAIGNAPVQRLGLDQPCSVRLILDFAKADPILDLYGYEATVSALMLGSGDHTPVGGSSGTIAPSDAATIDLDGQKLPPGMYRLEALITLWPANPEHRSPIMHVFSEGGLLQIC